MALVGDNVRITKGAVTVNPPSEQWRTAPLIPHVNLGTDRHNGLAAHWAILRHNDAHGTITTKDHKTRRQHLGPLARHGASATAA